MSCLIIASSSSSCALASCQCQVGRTTLSAQPDAQGLMPALCSAQHFECRMETSLHLLRKCFCSKKSAFDPPPPQCCWLAAAAALWNVEKKRCNSTGFSKPFPQEKWLQVKQYFQETFQTPQLCDTSPSSLCPSTLLHGRALQRMMGLTLCLPTPLLPPAIGFSSARPAG